jgi:hypothetical protein
MALCQPFGAVTNIFILQAKSQALVEFQDVNGAMALLGQAARYPLTLRFNFFSFVFCITLVPQLISYPCPVLYSFPH